MVVRPEELNLIIGLIRPREEWFYRPNNIIHGLFDHGSEKEMDIVELQTKGTFKKTISCQINGAKDLVSFYV